MKIIFMLPTGAIEWPVPEDVKASFHFASVVTKIRADGFFMGETLYLRHDALVGMSFVADAVSPAVVRKDLQ